MCGKRRTSGCAEKVQKQKPRLWRGFAAILPLLGNNIDLLAERTGLEPATLGVTGRYSNQLNYRSKLQRVLLMSLTTTTSQNLWRPQGDSNPRTHRERVMS